MIKRVTLPSSLTAVPGPQNDGGLEKKTGPFKNGIFLVSMLDFWGVNSSKRRQT